MSIGRTPAAAIQAHLDAVREAAGCVTEERLILRERAKLVAGKRYPLSFRLLEPVLLDGDVPLGFTAGQFMRAVRPVNQERSGPFLVELTGYTYRFSTPANDEILSFHWTPDAAGAAITYPHLHIGPAILAPRPPLRPRDLHKAHIPTGPVSLAAAVRLAISEFGVRPLRPDWSAILDRVEGAAGG